LASGSVSSCNGFRAFLANSFSAVSVHDILAANTIFLIALFVALAIITANETVRAVEVVILLHFCFGFLLTQQHVEVPGTDKAEPLEEGRTDEGQPDGGQTDESQADKGAAMESHRSSKASVEGPPPMCDPIFEISQEEPEGEPLL
jgi:hypothetical protein